MIISRKDVKERKVQKLTALVQQPSFNSLRSKAFVQKPSFKSLRSKTFSDSFQQFLDLV